MSWLGLIFNGAPRQKANFSDHEQWFWDILTGGGASASGQRVTPATALHNPTFFAGVQAISQDIAKLPLVVMKVTGDKRERWRDNRLWPLLHDAPWEGMTSYRFRMAMQAQVLIRGNAYAEIFRDSRGRVLGLKPFRPGVVEVARYDADGALFYRVTDGRRVETLSADRMLHLRGLTLDGDVGVSAVSTLRESMGIALAAQDYAARFYANDATPRTVFTRQGHFPTDETRDKFLSGLIRMISGESRHKPLILEDGFDIKQMGMSHEDSQFIDTRKFQRNEQSASLRITPHKTGDYDKATFSNIEHSAIEYVVDTLMPHARNWESDLTLALVPEAEREATEIQLVMDALLRGDSQAQAKYFAVALGHGGGAAFMTPNEIRKLKDLNPHPDGDYLPMPAPANNGAMPDEPEPERDNDEMDATAAGKGDEPRDLRGNGARRLALRAIPDPRASAG